MNQQSSLTAPTREVTGPVTISRYEMRGGIDVVEILAGGDIIQRFTAPKNRRFVLTIDDGSLTFTPKK